VELFKDGSVHFIVDLITDENARMANICLDKNARIA